MDRVRVGQADRPDEHARQALFESAALTRLGSAKRIDAPVYRVSAAEGLRRRAGGGLR
jgi:hypothetical protein